MLVRTAAAIFASVAVVWAARAAAQPAPQPSPSPSPAVSATPNVLPPKSEKRFAMTALGSTGATDQQFTGPGIAPAEGPGFIAGNIVAPGTPYDYFTNAPLATGSGFDQTLRILPSYRLTPVLDVSADIGYGAIGGSGNVAAYWGDAPPAPLNPHTGQRHVTVPPAFPTHNNQDPVDGHVVSVLGGALSSHDGKYVLRAGWLQPAQTQGFVFTPPALTNAPPALAPVLPEGLGSGAPALDGFAPLDPALPLHGLDLIIKHGLATLEATDADLPTLSQTPARLRSLSLAIDHGKNLTYGFAIVHVVSGGAPQGTTVLFGGVDGLNYTVPSTQGTLPFSLLGGQRNTIAGVTASVPLRGGTDLTAKAGYSRYAADGTFRGGKAASGGFYYGKVHHTFRQFELSVEGVRFEPEYAPAQIPYGTLENVWSVAYSWPGTWLKGNYALADVSMVGPNRQGLRVSGRTAVAGVDVRLAYAQYAQLDPFDRANAYRTGFVEGYFMPQLSGGATLGREQHAAASLAWHPAIADVALDLTDITLSRPGARGNPDDAVAMNYPAAVFTLSREFGKRLLAAAGAGRYAVDGSFANSGPKNADLAQSVVFAGLQYAKDARVSYHVQYRLYSVHGVATVRSGPSPAFHGPQLMLVQRVRL